MNFLRRVTSGLLAPSRLNLCGERRLCLQSRTAAAPAAVIGSAKNNGVSGCENNTATTKSRDVSLLVTRGYRTLSSALTVNQTLPAGQSGKTCCHNCAPTMCASASCSIRVQNRGLLTVAPRVNILAPQTSTNSLRILVPPPSTVVAQSRGYKAKRRLRKRCPHCYFEKRQGRWFIECKVKPRHKQMAQMPRYKVFKED